MKYALLIYTVPGSHDALPEAERDAAYGEYVALVDDPRCVTPSSSQPITAATTVRRDNGQRLITDGPFADTKEFFGGYYIVEADEPRRGARVRRPHPDRPPRRCRRGPPARRPSSPEPAS